MTREGEITVLREHLSTASRLGDRMHDVRGRIAALYPMTSERLRALDGDAHINVLAFLKTYEQFEETLARTLKTIAMLMQLGKTERMTARDIASRAVALGILDDGRAWADAVRVRNELAHEYPLDPGKQAGQVNAAWEKSETLWATQSAIVAFVEAERLLEGDL